MKYVIIGWPEIQDYMNNPEFNKEIYFDPSKNCYFIPENIWENKEGIEDAYDMWGIGPDIGDLDDAMG